MLTRITLLGELSGLIPGGVFHARATTPAQALSALEANFPGFRKSIKDRSVVLLSGGKSYGSDELSWTLAQPELIISPPVEGEGGRAMKIIIGVALFATGIGAAWAAGGLTMASFGAAAFGNTLGISASHLVLAGAGLAFMGMAAPPETKGDFSRNEQERKPSVMYQGPLNSQEQGLAHPVVFGRSVRVGGVVTHADLETVNKVL